jgi:hypothetical protein
MVKIRDGVVTNRAVYLAVGIDCDGNKQVLGLWIGPTTGESAKFWLSVPLSMDLRPIYTAPDEAAAAGWKQALQAFTIYFDGRIPTP